MWGCTFVGWGGARTEDVDPGSVLCVLPAACGARLQKHAGRPGGEAERAQLPQLPQPAFLTLPSWSTHHLRGGWCQRHPAVQP